MSIDHCLHLLGNLLSNAFKGEIPFPVAGKRFNPSEVIRHLSLAYHHPLIDLHPLRGFRTFRGRS